MKKIPVALLGATGSVGQRFVSLLHNHPWFDLVAVAASERSQGKKYGEAVQWLLPDPLPSSIADLSVLSPDPATFDVSLVFSALDASVAGPIEAQCAEQGMMVISNTRNHRMAPQVPLLVPEINPDHLELITHQSTQGKIITNPNCSTIGLALALKPLHDRFGIKAVHVVTFQAVSGAGYPGVASLDILDNVVPFISGEEEKMEKEPLKILGKKVGNTVQPASIAISAHCNRVPVSDGHLECVSISLHTPATREQIIQTWREFRGAPQQHNLPLAPLMPLHYFDEPHFPQPKRHRHLDKGMAVTLGRLRPCPLFDYKFTLLSHNTIRGAAGGALLCGELAVMPNFSFV